MYILIVTGLSGAGKSQVLGILEDMGFVCADNMPCQLAKQYIELCSSSENNIERVALVIDSRESVFGYNPLNTYDELRRLECPYEIMFLECEDSVLVRRYSETRRRHPMNDDVGIGIQTEREILIPLKEKANYIVDTTNMRLNELRKTVEDILMRGKNIPLRLIISSFGFKRGIPKNADFIFDMRYTANPFYIEELRCKSGRDEEVRRFVFFRCKCPQAAEHDRKHAGSCDSGVYKAGQAAAYGCVRMHGRQASFRCNGGSTSRQNERQMLRSA